LTLLNAIRPSVAELKEYFGFRKNRKVYNVSNYCKVMAKQYYSKNHDATLCLLAREFYKEGINENDIELINIFFLDYQDLLLYVHSKDNREKASYSSKYAFDKDKVEELRLKSIDFVNKGRVILDSMLK